METLSSFLKKQRKTLKLTQSALADRAGVGLRFVREMEQGKPSLRLDKVNQVLDLFGCHMAPHAVPRASGGPDEPAS
jgi:y4mF family transcriptional regulator